MIASNMRANDKSAYRLSMRRMRTHSRCHLSFPWRETPLRLPPRCAFCGMRVSARNGNTHGQQFSCMHTHWFVQYVTMCMCMRMRMRMCMRMCTCMLRKQLRVGTTGRTCMDPEELQRMQEALISLYVISLNIKRTHIPAVHISHSYTSFAASSVNLVDVAHHCPSDGSLGSKSVHAS